MDAGGLVLSMFFSLEVIRRDEMRNSDGPRVGTAA